MINIREVSRSSGVDRKGVRTGQRVWELPVRDSNAAIAEVENQYGGINTDYPGEPGNVIDRFENSPSADGISTIVTAYYSSDKRYELGGRIDRDEQDFYAFRLSTVMGEIQIPYGVRKLTEVPSSGTSELLWHADTTIQKQPMERVSIQVTVENWHFGMTKIVRKQVGKIHGIPENGPDTQYRFEGADVVQRVGVIDGIKIYDVTYTWTGDPGNKASRFPNTNANLAYPNLDRVPFGEYKFNPAWTDPAVPPSFIMVYNWDESERDGWESLPGIPNL